MQYDSLKENEQPALTEKAAYLAKWLRILFFWSLFSGVVFAALRMDPVQIRIQQLAQNPQLVMVCTGMIGPVGAVYLFIKLGRVSSYYRFVIVCLIVSAGVELAIGDKGQNSPTWWAMRALGLIVSVVKTYQLYYGHAEVLGDFDPMLAGKWRRLWKWCVRLLLGIPVGLLTAQILPTVGGILLLVSFAGLAIQGILEFVYLWQTGTAFHGCVSAEPEAISEPKGHIE